MNAFILTPFVFNINRAFGFHSLFFKIKPHTSRPPLNDGVCKNKKHKFETI